MTHPIHDREVALPMTRDRYPTLRKLYVDHAPRLRTLVLRFGLDATAAEEAVQECFFRAHQNRERMPVPEKKRASWLTSIAANVCRTELLKREVRQRGGAVWAELQRESKAGPDGPDQNILLDENLKKMHRVLGSLDPRDRMVLVLARSEGLAPSEIATRLSMTPGSVRTRLCRALQRVRIEMEADSAP